MDAQVVTPVTPRPVAALVERLQTDSGPGATITLLPDGFTPGHTAQQFKIVLLGKSAVLTPLVYAQDVRIVHVAAKRTGKNVRTTVSLQVPYSSVHPQPSVN